MDDPLAVEAWRRYLQRYGVWANAPVPLFPYPGSPHYTKRWGLPDEHAWCVRYGAVRQLGHLGASALGHWLGRAAIYVLPARYEPFGLSILEAGLAGCALVVGDIPSLRENWDGAAVFVPPDDAEALAMELSRLIQKPERLGILADRAHTRAREFTPQRMCAGYLAAYQQLLRARQRQGLREKTGLTFS
jgi:glycosyltransferase involved in cell wall biosynthesis